MPTTGIDSLVAPKASSRRVWCTETGALTKGTALMFSPGAIGAIGPDPAVAVTSDDARRGAVVALPTYLNNQAFAGILARSYPANALGQEVEITYPENGVNVQVYVDGSVSEGQNVYAWPILGTGQYSASQKGAMGVGTVRIRGTRTGAGLVQGEFVACGGIETGGIQPLTAPAGGGAGTPMNTISKTGLTTFAAQTLAGNATFVLGAPDFDGQRKAFKVLGTQTTNNIVITLTPTGTAPDGSALTTITMDTIDSYTSLVGSGGKWLCENNTTSVLA